MIQQSLRVLAAFAVISLAATGGAQAQETTPTPPAKQSGDLDGDAQPLKAYSEALNLYVNQTAVELKGGLILGMVDPADETLGATLVPLNEAMHNQLNISNDRGVLIESLRDDGACALVGLKQYDVLLTLGGKPVTSADDLSKQLKAAGEKSMPLALLRAGKQMTIQVRPLYRVTLGRADEAKTEYFIGISLSAMDEALRSQLALPAGQGAIITDVVKDSPAEKAGVKVHDIVMEFAGQAVGASERLSEQVQASHGKPAAIKILRAGKPLSIEVTPAERLVKSTRMEAMPTIRYWTLSQRDLAGQIQADDLAIDKQSQQKRQARSSREVEELRQQVQELRKAVDKLNDSLNKPPPKQ